MKKNKGFTLIEVIISIAIISIVGFSVMNMFNTSTKVNRNAKELDYANLKATNTVEKIKNAPLEFTKTMDLRDEAYFKDKQVVINKEDANRLEKRYAKVIYYDYSWNEVSKKKDAKFKATVNLTEERFLGEPTSVKPKKYKTNTGKDPTIYGNADDYLIVTIDIIGADKDTTTNADYETYVLEGYTEETFKKWLFSEDGYKPIFIQKALTREKNPAPSEKVAIQWYNGTKNLGYERLRFYALRDMAKEWQQDYELKKNIGGGAIDGIPYYLKFNNPNKKYNIEVLNCSSKKLDIYITGNEKSTIKNNTKFTSSQGTFSTTYLSEGRVYETKFHGDIIVSSLDNKRILSKLPINQYRPN
ncbi:prepilin-type N-terminal cleavage/methylation domain-containing protein [Hathewaya histolytica]|uniref:prepilin-type N-terminal cleavage/methylation domain-containing protein n=1 Tax=Hathewaya histolytica TaxID=1498 RepID=UPI003B685FBA